MPPRNRRRFSLPAALALALLTPALSSAQGVEAPRIPLRTAVSEINAFRAQYAGALNGKDATSLTAMYAPDAVLIRGDGRTLVGRPAIGDALAEESSSWTQTTFTSDTLRVFGNTAWEVGRLSGPDGKDVRHYLVVLRRDLKGWKISSVAVVPDNQTKSTK
jgi:ketosteroid isomerase-like protein